MGGLFIAVVLAFPRGLAGLVHRSDPAAASSGCSGARADAIRRSRHQRRAGGIGDQTMSYSTDFLLALENVTRLVRRLQGRQRAQPLHRQGRAARHHRPQRRRQDHRARPDLRPHQGVGGLDQVQGPGDHRPQGARDRPPRHRPQIPDAVDLRRPHGVREPRNLGAARPQRRRRAVLEAHAGGRSNACARSRG